MGVSIGWKPKGKVFNNITPNCSSRCWGAIQDTFGDCPVTLYQKDIPILKGMANVWDLNWGENPFIKLISALSIYKEIEVDILT